MKIPSWLGESVTLKSFDMRNLKTYLSPSTLQSIFDFIEYRHHVVDEDCSIDTAVAEAAEIAKNQMLVALASKKGNRGIKHNIEETDN